MLRWLERTFLAIGLVLGVWCGVVLLNAYRVSRMPVPAPPGREDVSIPPAESHPAPITGTWVARLDAPSVHLSATVLEGSDDATLARGAGHIEDTAFPWQSGNGNVGIAGHRDTTFRAVRHLRQGDPLELTTSDRIYRYQITKTFIVEPEDVYVLDRGDRPMLTLVTCFPFEFIGHAPHRYIIQAVLTEQMVRGAPVEPAAELAGMAARAGR